MRVGLTVSIIGHAAILGFGVLAFPEARPFAPDEVEALPVELIDVAEVTELAIGDESATELPTETPQPEEQIAADTPTPAPGEEPAETPAESAAPAPAPQAPPEPETVASLPQPAEPEPAPEETEAVPEAEPEPRVPVDPRVPQARPEPPPLLPEPTPPQEAPAAVARSQQAFDADEIAALLDKRVPSGGGLQPTIEVPTLGRVAGRSEPEMTQSEIAALKARLYQCWNPPVAMRDAAGLVVTVRIALFPDGSLNGPPQIVAIGQVSDPLAQVAAEAALRAVVQCAPFGDILRPETFAVWNKIDFVFDPREMLGG